MHPLQTKEHICSKTNWNSFILSGKFFSLFDQQVGHSSKIKKREKKERKRKKETENLQKMPVLL
jgi:hypothetical protein